MQRTPLPSLDVARAAGRIELLKAVAMVCEGGMGCRSFDGLRNILSLLFQGSYPGQCRVVEVFLSSSNVDSV